jgi:abhydrolase domain-containing protein 13
VLLPFFKLIFFKVKFDDYENYLVYQRAYLPERDFGFNSTVYEHVSLRTKDKVCVNAYFLKQRGNLLNKSPTIVCFLGNTGNFDQRLELAKNFYTYCSSNVLFVEYRGFGSSRDIPSEKGLYLDAKSAIEYVFSRDDLDKTKINIYGEDIGAAVAIDTGL